MRGATCRRRDAFICNLLLRVGDEGTEDVQAQEKVGQLGGSNAARIDDFGQASVLGYGEVSALLHDVLHHFRVVDVPSGIATRSLRGNGLGFSDKASSVTVSGLRELGGNSIQIGMTAGSREQLAVVLTQGSSLLVQELNEVFDGAPGLVRQALLVVLGKPLQRGVSAHVELRALGLVRVAINLHDRNSGFARKSLRHFLVVRGQALAMAAPRRVKFDEHVLAGVENDSVKVPFVGGDDRLGHLGHAHRVARFSVEILHDAGGVAGSVVLLGEGVSAERCYTTRSGIGVAI